MPFNFGLSNSIEKGRFAIAVPLQPLIPGVESRGDFNLKFQGENDCLADSLFALGIVKSFEAKFPGKDILYLANPEDWENMGLE